MSDFLKFVGHAASFQRHGAIVCAIATFHHIGLITLAMNAAWPLTYQPPVLAADAASLVAINFFAGVEPSHGTSGTLGTMHLWHPV